MEGTVMFYTIYGGIYVVLMCMLSWTVYERILDCRYTWLRAGFFWFVFMAALIPVILAREGFQYAANVILLWRQ